MRTSFLSEEGLGEFLQGIYACRDTTALSERIVRELPRLIAADQVIFNYLRVAAGAGWFVAWPRLARHEEQSRLFLRHMHEHPKLQHYSVSGDPSAGAISDFMSARRFQRTALYNELYREMGYEDHMGILLGPPGAVVIGIGVGRGSRSFTERDRQVLNWVRPHIAQAWRNAKSYTRLARLCRLHMSDPYPTDEFNLTARECQIIDEIGQGKSNHEIAKTLFISVPTVKKHLEHIYAKLSVKSRTAALAKLRAYRTG